MHRDWLLAVVACEDLEMCSSYLTPAVRVGPPRARLLGGGGDVGVRLCSRHNAVKSAQHLFCCAAEPRAALLRRV